MPMPTDRLSQLGADQCEEAFDHACHSRFKRSEEKGGTKHLTGCDVNGEPLFYDW
jgi:hypothetical protein